MGKQEFRVRRNFDNKCLNIQATLEISSTHFGG